MFETIHYISAFDPCKNPKKSPVNNFIHSVSRNCNGSAFGIVKGEVGNCDVYRYIEGLQQTTPTRPTLAAGTGSASQFT